MSRSADDAAGLEPLLVSPRQARQLLNISNTKLYAMLGAGELPSCLVGKSRRIPLTALRAYISRRVAENAGKRPRGRPRKVPLTAVVERVGAAT
jgi:excisionase family DNA binding protein